jgi:hypothetical protein
LTSQTANGALPYLPAVDVRCLLAAGVVVERYESDDVGVPAAHLRAGLARPGILTRSCRE